MLVNITVCELHLYRMVIFLQVC